MLSQAHMRADAEAAAEQRKAYEQTSALIEEIPNMDAERFAHIKKMAAHNTWFLEEKHEYYMARQWKRLLDAINDFERSNEMQSTKIAVKNITITPVEESIGSSFDPVTVESFDAADSLLFKIAKRVKPNSGYRKTVFEIVFEDGTKYTGRYDVESLQKEFPDLLAHVRDFVRFSAGIDRPDHMTEEDWRDYLAGVEHTNPGIVKQYANFARNYDIGIDA